MQTNQESGREDAKVPSARFQEVPSGGFEPLILGLKGRRPEPLDDEGKEPLAGFEPAYPGWEPDILGRWMTEARGC